MGNTIFRRLFGKQEKLIFFMGLDGVGKSTVLYRLKLGEVVRPISTVTFNVEKVHLLNVTLTAWDVGGRDKGRPMYKHYYPKTDGLVYVIDSNDRGRFQYTIDELKRYVLDEKRLKGVPLLVMANKQDVKNAMLPEEIASSLEGVQQLKQRNWRVIGVSAVDKNNPGIVEAMEWLVKAMDIKDKQELSERWIQAWGPQSEI